MDYTTSLKSCNYAEKFDTLFYAGIHPLYSENSVYIPVNSDRCIAIGECGLDYYRLQFSSIETQKRIFKVQLDLKAERYFLHCRDSHRDFMEILSDYNFKGVVHSFTGTVEESKEIIKKGLFIGINGCSLKNEEGIEVVKNLPLNSILVETDSPYCKIRKSYAGYKFVNNYQKHKSNEPYLIYEIIEAIANIKNIPINILLDTLLSNNINFYGERLVECFEKWRL